MLLLVTFAVLASAPPSAPTRMSQLDGWHGVHLRRGNGGTADWCDIVFPDGFGERDGSEMSTLRRLASAGATSALKLDGTCPVPFRLQNALAQLRHLAVDRQVREAALALVQAERPGGLDLGGGEVAEVFTAQFLVPVLLGFRDLRQLLTPQLERHVAHKVAAAGCTEMDQGVDVDAVIKGLRARGMPSLAQAIRTRCTELEKEL